MPLKLSLIFFFSYVLVTLLQFVASLDGIMHFLGLHWIFALFAAGILAIIPAIGPLAGVYGAVQVWGWPAWAAIVLFFWPYLLYGILAALGLTGSVLFWKKAFRPFRRDVPEDIEPDYTVKEESADAEILFIERKP